MFLFFATYLFSIKDEDPTVTGNSVTIAETATSQSIHTMVIEDADTADITAAPFSVTMTGSSDFSLVKTATGCKLRRHFPFVWFDYFASAILICFVFRALVFSYAFVKTN